LVWLLVGVSGLVGSVPAVVFVLVEQLEGVGGLGEDAEGFGAAHLHRVWVALLGKDVGDPINGGFEPDGIPGGGSGDDHLQPVFRAAAQLHEPLLCCRGGALFRTGRVGLNDRGIDKGLQPAEGHRAQ
jgi:hypothetical protein